MIQIAKIDRQFEKRDKQRKINAEFQKQQDFNVEQTYLNYRQNISAGYKATTNGTSPDQSSPSPEIILSSQIRDPIPIRDWVQPIQADNLVTEHLKLKKQSFREEYAQQKLNILDQFDMRSIAVEGSKLGKKFSKRSKSGFRVVN